MTTRFRSEALSLDGETRGRLVRELGVRVADGLTIEDSAARSRRPVAVTTTVLVHRAAARARY